MADERFHVGRAREGVFLDGDVGGLGAAVEALVEPEIRQHQFLVARGFHPLQRAGLEQAQRGVLERFAAREEFFFGQDLDFAVAVEQFHGAAGSVPGDGHVGRGVGLVAQARGQQHQQGPVAGEPAGQFRFVGLHDREHAVVGAGRGAQGVAVHLGGPRGGRQDLVELVGVEARAVGGEEGGDDGAVGARLVRRHRGHAVEGQAFGAGPAGRGAAGGQGQQRQEPEPPALPAEERLAGTAHGRA